MAIEHRMVHFRSDDCRAVINELDRIAGAGCATRNPEWVTVSPWVDADELPVTSVLRRLFTARGPKVPAVTWVPAQSGEPAQLGVLHASGGGAAARCADAGVAVPDDWVELSDHIKRGLLFAIHPSTPASAVVDIAVGLAAALAEVPTDDRWVAQVSSLGQ